ncbi:MAG: GDP-L-fucose synthase [Proteobacteria bacterium]|nr:GDP-L-fucose synthase [Pseudomonadota bacterium]MBU1688201.1 GDP-L-fucose synthase [Pseudomonadota bacterium]
MSPPHPSPLTPHSSIFIPGHRGLVGSALVRRLTAAGYTNLLTRTRAELDLLDPVAVREFFALEQPEYVFLAAAKVGGILANNTYPADFIYQNLTIQNNIIDASHRNGVKRLLFLGSSCIYPKLAPQPLKEEYLLTGPLEQTNDAYAVAKIAGIKMCEAYNRQYGTRYLSVMPTNLYGPGDNFDLANSHVLPALIRKFHEARLNKAPSVTVWGSGSPRREFLHVDDMADACLFLMTLPEDRFILLTTSLQPTIINIGYGVDVTIAELAELVREATGFPGTIVYDRTKPDGTPRKLLDVSRLHNLGWQAKTDLKSGIEQTYEWYKRLG